VQYRLRLGDLKAFPLIDTGRAIGLVRVHQRARSAAHNLAETNVDVRVDTLRSDMSTNAGLPTVICQGSVGFVGCSTAVVVSGVSAQSATGESRKT